MLFNCFSTGISYMKRYYIIYKGIVQGVGFRYRLAMLAQKYNLTGYAKNLDDGDVEVEIQGNDVDAFLMDSLKKDMYVQIFDYCIKEISLDNHETSFKIKY